MNAELLESASPGGKCRSLNFAFRALLGRRYGSWSPHSSVPHAPRSNGWRCRVIRAATAKEGFFAITVDDVDTIGVIVGVELERGAAEWKGLPGSEWFD